MGFQWSDDVVAFLMKPYSYSMGILALLVAGTTAKSLTDSVNRSMEKNQPNQLYVNSISCYCWFIDLGS